MGQRLQTSRLPANPFFSTPQQRMALARQRFFEDGARPSGLVSESIIQSWVRCQQARRDPDENLSFNPVTASRIQSALARNRLLLETAAGELNQLRDTLAGSACTVILTDPQGVVVHAAWAGAHADEALLPLARRVGVDLGEDSIGTCAPGLTARTGVPSSVMGGEHFFGAVQAMHCAAAPIRDVRGQVAGVLDLSSESQPFGFDAPAVVGLYATSIENRLLRAQSHEHIVLHLQTLPSLLGTPMEGLAGIAADGSVAWLNGAAARLLGHPHVGAALRADELFGLELHRLSALTRQPEASAHRLPCGLSVWLVARMQAPDGLAMAFKLHAAVGVAGAASNPPDSPGALPELPEPLKALALAPALTVPQPPAATLRTAGQHLIEQTLADCDGNVSMAARRLGVSRGLVYRHLRNATTD